MEGEHTSLLDTAELLCAPKKLERDRGELALRQLNFNETDIKCMRDWVMEKSDNIHNWEDIFGALTLSRIIFEKCPESILTPLHFQEEIIAKMPEMDSHYEYRVRIAAGELMGTLCSLGGTAVFLQFLPRIIAGIEENLDRDPLSLQKEAEESQKELNFVTDQNPNLSRSSLSIFHDTAGWKNLETWMKCLHYTICGLRSARFSEYRDPAILALIFKAVSHTNRFVRETGYDLLGTIIENQGCGGVGMDQAGEESVPDYIRVAKQLAIGLADNWSQVRMAAAKSVRKLFEVPPPPNQSIEVIYPILLPPLCLNRFYVAEGVRLFSQQTWCQVTGGQGRELLHSVLQPTLEYYLKQTVVDNHAVREAACAALAEVGMKLPADSLRPHLGDLLKALYTCFKDDSWPVRDAACIALGNLVSVFPKETREAGYQDLMIQQFLSSLIDVIPSVRDGAASSIAKVLQSANDDEIEKMCIEFVTKQLSEIETQSADSKGATSERMSRGPGASIAVHTANTAHDKKHTNQTMYSCCSLATKTKKGGGCFENHSQRPSEPWECADGAIRFIGELCTFAPSKVTDALIDKMISAASHTNYPHHPYLLETACHTVKALCLGMDKVAFKRNLDSLLPVLACSVGSDQPLAIAAAEDCLVTLTTKIGPNVIRSRIQSHFESTTVSRLLNYLPATAY